MLNICRKFIKHQYDFSTSFGLGISFELGTSFINLNLNLNLVPCIVLVFQVLLLRFCAGVIPVIHQHAIVLQFRLIFKKNGEVLTCPGAYVKYS